MWHDPRDKINNHLKVSNTLQIESLVIGEWNMNDFVSLANYGAYKYRPSTASSAYYRTPSSYDEIDTGNYYTGVKDSYYTFADFVDDDDNPVLFQSDDVDRMLYYDLKECFSSFRPRSGINKPLYFDGRYIDSVRSARRPRYYMASRYDTFKYWNSYRNQTDLSSGENNTTGIFQVASSTESTESIATERGISFVSNPDGINNSIGYIIEDTCPFVVYEEAFPANRIVVKMQTNLADTDSERSIRIASDETLIDPLQNRSLSSIPQRWKIEYLDESNNWVTAVAFDENSLRRDGTDIVKWDGHVEIYYGIKVPQEYKDSFNLISTLDFVEQLPQNNLNGESYLIGSSINDAGILYIWNEEIEDWVQEQAEYGFSLLEDDDTKRIGTITSLSNPEYFIDIDGFIRYRELLFIKGLRLTVETMIAPDTTFDLIELSPRIHADLSKYTQSYSFTKSIANDSTGLPVGGLVASNGNISLFDEDGVFVYNNPLVFTSDDVVIGKTPRQGSIIAKYLKPNVKFMLYEAVLNVDGYDVFVPIKTMYSEEFPNATGDGNPIQVPVRDLFFRLETLRAPQILLTSSTLTSAVAFLLDSVGFSNYIFKGFDDLIVSSTGVPYPDTYPPIPEDRVFVGGTPYFNEATGILMPKNEAWELYWEITGEDRKLSYTEFINSINDPVIPYFFVTSDYSVSQVLVDLALSCQAAMFFDEYNNFVVMPKEYLLPESEQRQTEFTLYGQTDIVDSSIRSLSNIISVNANNTKVLNDGVIEYSVRYIQREVTALSQAYYIDQDKTYGYKPVLLWEVGGTEETKTTNEESKQSSEYALGAAVLNTDLSSVVPYVENNEIKNNIIDLGESVYWLPRFQSYLYANGEIIRYDAIEYDISGTGKKWINTNAQYQKYFSSIPFNGKMYPTGNVRIYTEPYYVEYENAPKVSGLSENVTYKNGEVKRHGRGQFGTEIVSHQAGLDPYWSNNQWVRGLKMESKYIFSTTPTEKISYPSPLTYTTNPVGKNNSLAKKSSRNGIIKNMFAKTYPSDDEVKILSTAKTGTIQASALSFNGPSDFDTSIPKKDFISYVYRPLYSAFKHYGTRLRIIGKLENNDNVQTPINSTTYFNVQPNSSSESVNIDGGSGGIAIGLNPASNHGYYFEICALTKDNLENYFSTNTTTGQEESVLHNIIFYKIMKSGGKAIPVKLWGGLAPIIVDEGQFVGMDRISSEGKPTVYDLAVEYETLSNNTRKFYLYLNNSQVATVVDSNPLPEYQNVALFVRGSSHVMFENIYALQNLMARNTGATVVDQISDAFDINSVNATESMRQYNLSGFIRSSYLAGVSSSYAPKYKIYFEEFGTIMRECSYFNVKYDQAYPALIAKIAETFVADRGYSISGFYAGSYGAEFLIFNNTDRAISLTDSTGNYLRIIGVTFTQNVVERLSVDDFFASRSDFSDPFIKNDSILSPVVVEKKYEDVKSSRKKYGKREFSMNPIYIQTVDDANNLMEWLVEKTLRERRVLDIKTFGTPHLQLGDIVNVNFIMPEGVYLVDPKKQFIVQGIDFSRSTNSLETILRVVEI